jgi:hypothetical protein
LAVEELGWRQRLERYPQKQRFFSHLLGQPAQLRTPKLFSLELPMVQEREVVLKIGGVVVALAAKFDTVE